MLLSQPETLLRNLPESFHLGFRNLTSQVADLDSTSAAARDDFSLLEDTVSSGIHPRLFPGVSISHFLLFRRPNIPGNNPRLLQGSYPR